MQLRTEIGESILNKNLGTQLSLMRHRNINDFSTLQKIHDIVKDNLREILDNPAVMVKPEYSDGNFFCQNVNIYIYDGNTPIYTFSL